MKNLFLLTVLGLITTLDCLAGPGQWSADLYDVHTWQSFAKFEPAQKIIDSQHVNYPLLHAAVFYETNRQRAMHHLPVFRHLAALETAAARHSWDMVNYDFFDHVSPVEGKKTLRDRLAQVGVVKTMMAENIAFLSLLAYEAGKPVYTPEQNGGYFSYVYKGEPLQMHTYISLARAVVKQWMNSPGHRRNILNGELVYLGCGAAVIKDKSFHGMEKVKVTQNFAGTLSEQE